MKPMTDAEKAMLKTQLGKTILDLNQNFKQSRQKILDDYLNEYRNVLDLVNGFEESKMLAAFLDDLITYATGYLETAQRWDQAFLKEMGRTEKIIKSLIARAIETETPIAVAVFEKWPAKAISCPNQWRGLCGSSQYWCWPLAKKKAPTRSA